MKMKSVEAASVASAKMVAATLAAVVLGSLALKALERATGGQLGQSKGKGFNVAAAAAAATLKPAQASVGGRGGPAERCNARQERSGAACTRAVKLADAGAAWCQGRKHGTLCTRLHNEQTSTGCLTMPLPVPPCCRPCCPSTVSPTRRPCCPPWCKWPRSKGRASLPFCAVSAAPGSWAAARHQGVHPLRQESLPAGLPDCMPEQADADSFDS